jgi:prepilin peptidase CpaA
VFLIVVTAAVIDLRHREVPHWIPLSLLALAVVATALGWTGTSWSQLAFGALLGFALPAALFCLGGLGGGDVKLLAALGALLGPWGWIQAVIWIGLAGGVLALVSLWRRQREYAYVPAIAIGLVIHLTLSTNWTV